MGIYQYLCKFFHLVQIIQTARAAAEKSSMFPGTKPLFISSNPISRQEKTRIIAAQAPAKQFHLSEENIFDFAKKMFAANKTQDENINTKI